MARYAGSARWLFPGGAFSRRGIPCWGNRDLLPLPGTAACHTGPGQSCLARCGLGSR
jgi:hypothetical protein